MLDWKVGEDNILRANDENSVYVVARSSDGQYVVGYFMPPGVEGIWGPSVAKVAAAKQLAEECALHLRLLRQRTRPLGWTMHDRSTDELQALTDDQLAEELHKLHAQVSKHQAEGERRAAM